MRGPAGSTGTGVHECSLSLQKRPGSSPSWLINLRASASWPSLATRPSLDTEGNWTKWPPRVCPVPDVLDSLLDSKKGSRARSESSLWNLLSYRPTRPQVRVPPSWSAEATGRTLLPLRLLWGWKQVMWLEEVSNGPGVQQPNTSWVMLAFYTRSELLIFLGRLRDRSRGCSHVSTHFVKIHWVKT